MYLFDFEVGQDETKATGATGATGIVSDTDITVERLSQDLDKNTARFPVFSCTM